MQRVCERRVCAANALKSGIPMADIGRKNCAKKLCLASKQKSAD